MDELKPGKMVTISDANADQHQQYTDEKGETKGKGLAPLTVPAGAAYECERCGFAVLVVAGCSCAAGPELACCGAPLVRKALTFSSWEWL